MGLAQVLCRSPQVLLLDEPFSALDAPVRLELRRELRRVQRETGLATVLVTHDPEEAAFLSDELLVIARGEVLQSGPSRSVFSRPLSPEVARLVGVDNVQRGSVVSSTLAGGRRGAGDDIFRRRWRSARRCTGACDRTTWRSRH